MDTDKNFALQLLQAHQGKQFEKTPSPFGKWLNLRIVDAQAGKLVFDYEVRPEMANPAKILHGGVTAAMMDDILGATMLSLGELNFKISINLNIDYFYPAKVGDTVRLSSNIIKRGQRLINAECEMSDSNGKILAKGYSNLFSSDIQIIL